MPTFLRPFVGYNFGDSGPDRKEEDTDITISGGGGVFTTPPLEVRGRGDKTFFIMSTIKLRIDIYIVPYRECKQAGWLLYKDNHVINPNDPWIFFSNDVVPFFAVKLTNAQVNPATVQGWLFAQ